jgi:precorrin-2/cobalt-factor-2 C20-methyltransferase
MPFGKLYGVGVGPGAPDLMTVRAVNVLKQVDVIAIPRRSEFDASVAWGIAEPMVGAVEGQERLYLNFPMVKDPSILRPAWDIAFTKILERLKQGKSVAFIAEGDPFIYSTFIYLYHEAVERWPGVEIEVVPAVSSIQAVPALVGMPLADGQERIAILPATYGTEDLKQVFQNFDTTILMKVGKVMPEIVEALESEGLLDRAVYVSRGTMDRQKVVTDLRSIKNDRCDYFSMVVVRKGNRAGILFKQAPVHA